MCQLPVRVYLNSFLFLSLFTLLSLFVSGQQVRVSGTVLSSVDSSALSGATVSVRGTGTSTQTDNQGRFTIAASRGARLTVSYIGFTAREVVVQDDAFITIILVSGTNSLNDIVVTGFTTQRKSDVTAAVSTISGADILKAPVTNVTNALVGRVPGLIAQQSSGRPGMNQAELFIRGRVSNDAKALIVVDGIERETFGDIDPNEIESITVLKDAASTSMYGIKGANGVFVVTTKMGRDGKARVSVSSNLGIQGYRALPGILPAYESALLHTEGQVNVGQGANRLFTNEDLQKFKDGTGDPLLYPNVNWYKALTRPSWMQTQNNINISGGSRFARYFTSFGHTFEDGMFKDLPTRSNLKTTPDYNRYNFRANVDFNPTPSTVIGVRVSGRLEKRYALSGISTAADWRRAWAHGEEGFVSRILFIPSWGLPFFPELTGDPYDPRGVYNQVEDFSRLGTNTFNPYAVMTGSGYFAWDNNVSENIVSVNQKLDRITKGLSMRGVFGYTAVMSSVRFQTGVYAAYNLDRNTKQLSPARSTYDAPLQNIRFQSYGDQKTSLQLFLNYDRGFGNHNVAGNLIGTRDLREIEGSAGPLSAPYANQGLIFNFAYNYKRKYFVQLNGAYNGSENYPKDKRYGLFPALSVGYTLTQERFMENISWINNLKLRGSIGLSGIPGPFSRFLYLDAYGGGNPVSFGTNITQVPTFAHTQVGNELITWEKSLKRNIGLESSFFGDKLGFNFDVYDDRRFDMVLPRNNTSFATYGESLPPVNYGENYNRGYEAELIHRNKIGNLTLVFNAQLSYNKNKVVIADEPGQQPDYMRITGLPIGQHRGFKVLGFYKDAADIAASPLNKLTSNTSIPGDFKYADINGDNVIDNLDQVPIGYSNIPEYVGGMGMTLGYKGFSASVLFQGVDNVSSDLIFYSSGTNQYYEPMLGRWTPDNPNPTWPVMRPGNQPGGNPNETNNDFLLQDASYVKLRNVEVRYTLPRAFTNRLKMQGASIYVNGQNLATWTKFYGLDPENYTNQTGFDNKRTTYPSTRIVNFGLNLQL
jgi:TonB-linked SusC/RagA family outer membrane protein